MKLQNTTDYGIRVMCILYKKKNSLTIAAEIADELCISYGYLLKVLGCLKEGGMIEAVHGRLGGYRIAESMRDATLYDIIQVMEGKIKLNSCLGDEDYCSRETKKKCSVHAVLESTQHKLVSTLHEVTLSELAGE